MIKTYHWHLEILQAPMALRHCKKCAVKTEFVSSGCFRVNANQRLLDIWLIYRCTHCKTTWNATIHSRISPQRLSPQLLANFQDNDAQLAASYAMDAAMLRRNGAELGQTDYLLHTDGELPTAPCQIALSSAYDTNIKILKVIREGCNFTRVACDQLLAQERLNLADGRAIERANVQKEQLILLGDSAAKTKLKR